MPRPLDTPRRMIPVLVLALALVGGARSEAACNFQFEVRNEGSQPFALIPESFQVRSRTFVPALLGQTDVGGAIAPVTRPWGPWRRAQRGGWFDNRNRVRVAPGATVADTYRAQALCIDWREVRGDILCQGGGLEGRTQRVTLEAFQGNGFNPQIVIRVRAHVCPT